MKRTDIDVVKKQTDLRDLAGRYTRLKRESARESAGPCPKCGGDDRFHATADWWFCRQCHPARGDAIEFVRWLEPALTFRDAVERLGGNILPAAKPSSPVSDGWERRGAGLVAKAQACLWAPEGEPGQAYLEARRLDPAAWLVFGIGYLPATPTQERSAAIVLPWYRRGRLVAVRFRFLRPQKRKLAALTGSRFVNVLFGGQAVAGPERASTLVLVEGELNAMSIWQVARWTELDVLSLGSESAKLPEAMRHIAARYRTVLTWFDRPEVARKLAAALPGACPICSPGGKDANDLLREGLLGGFLAMARADAARSTEELEALLRALWNGASSPGGLDTGSAQVCKELAARLGRRAELIEAGRDRWIPA